MARSRKTQTPEITVPTVTDEQYKELLAIRLTAMHGFEAGKVDEATMKLARAAVRRARKVRKAEEASGVLPAYRDHLVKQAEAKSEAAKKAAATRKSRRTTKVEPKAETEPAPEVTPAENETPNETEPVTENAA